MWEKVGTGDDRGGMRWKERWERMVAGLAVAERWWCEGDHGVGTEAYSTSSLPAWHTCGDACTGGRAQHAQTKGTMAVGDVRHAGGNSATMAAVVAAVMEEVPPWWW